MNNMTDTRKCQWCDTQLEWTQDGTRWSFTAHTDQFCRDATRQRVKDLEQTIASIHETYARRIAREMRAIDKILTEAGLPSLADRAKAAEEVRQARRVMAEQHATPLATPSWLTEEKP